MTKYRLKDQELQKKLDEISDGEFSKNLHKFDENHFASYWGKTIFFTINEDDDGEELEESKHIREPQFGVWFNIGEIEEVPEYNPNNWNNYPDVTPPEGVLMRVETTTGSKFCGYYHTFAEGGCWCYEDGTVCPEALSKSVERYRPWE